MSDAIRSLLAEFVVEVDKAGALAKGNADVDALKLKLAQLTEAAKPAAKAVSDIFAQAAQAARRNMQAIGASQWGGGGAGGDGFYGAGALLAKQVGPTRDTLNAGRAQMAAAEQAAAAYALTLRGRLASAVDAVRAGFNAPSGGKGPGLIESLATVRNGMLALGAGAAVRGVKGLVDGIGDIRESAQRLGVTTDQFQRLRVMAEQNGTSVQALGTAFRTLANSAVQPTKESTAAFAKLGVTVKDSNGQFKSTNDLFFEVAAALAGVSNETQRSALAQDLLGRGAQELKPLFAAGTAEILKQREALSALNVLSEETIIQADELSDSWKTLGPSFLSAAEPLLNILIPALTALTNAIVAGIATMGKWLKQTDLTAVGLTALGAVLTLRVIPGLRLMIGLGGGASRVFLSMAGSAARAAWAFARMVVPLLVIEDFITFLRGGETVIGKLLDKLGGKGTSTGVLKELAGLWDSLAGSVKYVLELMGLRDMTKEDKQQANRGVSYVEGLKNLASGAWMEANRSTVAQAQTNQRGREDLYARPNVVVGDSNVTVTMGPSATAGDVGREVGSVVKRERDALLSAYGGL